MRSETAGAVIHYRMDGLDPDELDPVVASGSTVLIDQPTHFKARAYKAGTPVSGVASGDYRITGAAATIDNGTVALKADGTVWTWGRNEFSVLGAPGNFVADDARAGGGDQPTSSRSPGAAITWSP